MAEVYWIRLPGHTDVFSQGYVGVTKNTALTRFKEHKQRSKSDNYLSISKAIHKYGEGNLTVSTLLVGDIDYCMEIESKLRPSPYIGWNISTGGGGCTVSRVVSDEQKIRHSEIMKQWWKDNPDFDNSVRGRAGVKMDRTPEWTEKLVESKFYNLPFRSPWWVNAYDYYQDYLSGLTYSHAQKKHNLKVGQLVHMWKRFNSGWNPSEDERWSDTIKRFRGINGSLTSANS